MKSTERLEILLKKYIADTADPGEKSELAELVASIDDETLNRLLEKSYETTVPIQEVLNAEEAKEILRKILGQEGKPGIMKIMYRKWFRYSVAATIILMLGAGLYYMFPGIKHQETVLTENNRQLRNDIKPGGNKAILTLADGSSIILDSAKNGMLAQQSGTRVIKTGTGQLAYATSSNKPSEMLYNTVTTPRGGQYQLTLPDGSKVWLNAASSIRFPVAFAGKERKVEITGEAYFEVTKNTFKPFRVSIIPSVAEIEVLGTRFNINAYTDEATLNTTLVEGSVKVTKGNAIQMLSPGQQARVNADGQIALRTSVNMEEVLAWKNGMFIFDHNDIREIMRQISKWYNVDVVFQGEPMHLTFSGVVSRNSNVSKTLEIMEQAGVKFIIEENKIIVM